MLWAGIRWKFHSKILMKSTCDSQFFLFLFYFWIEIPLYACFNALVKIFWVNFNFILLGFSVVVFILFLITSNRRLLLKLLKNSIVAGIPMIISKSLAPGTCHNSLIDFYVFVSFLSLDNFLLFILYTCKSQYDVSQYDDSLHNVFILYCIRCRVWERCWSVEGGVGNFNNRVISNFWYIRSS